MCPDRRPLAALHWEEWQHVSAVGLHLMGPGPSARRATAAPARRIAGGIEVLCDLIDVLAVELRTRGACAVRRCNRLPIQEGSENFGGRGNAWRAWSISADGDLAGCQSSSPRTLEPYAGSEMSAGVEVVLEELERLRLRARCRRHKEESADERKHTTQRRHKAAAGARHRCLLHPHVGGHPRAKEAGGREQEEAG